MEAFDSFDEFDEKLMQKREFPTLTEVLMYEADIEEMEILEEAQKDAPVSVEEAPAEEAPVEEPAVEEAPAEEAPAEEAPAEEAPVEEPAVEADPEPKRGRKKKEV